MRTIIFIAILLFVSNNIIAQTSYYTETKTFYEEGYTYQVDVPTITNVELYNKENKWIYVDSRYKDTGLFIDAVLEEYDVTILDEKVWKSARSTLHSIIANSFPEDVKEMSRASDYELFVILYINSQTGDVDEVSFSFSNYAAYAYAPVEVYRKMELEMKEKLKFVVTEEGKKLNYIYYWDYYRFK